MKPVVLCILDGFGHREAPEANAISLAHKTTLPRLFARYPFTTLACSGLEVGLPEGQMGNSEVGHTILGGGRVVYQDLPRISKAIRDGDFFVNPQLVATVEAVKARGGTLHVVVRRPRVTSTVRGPVCHAGPQRPTGPERVHLTIPTDRPLGAPLVVRYPARRFVGGTGAVHVAKSAAMAASHASCEARA